MKISVPKSSWRLFITVFFEIVFCILLYHAYSLMSHSDSPQPWMVGDWLINYQGGLVRRGLIGEILLLLSQWSSINLVVLVVSFQILLYATFLINTCRLAINSVRSALNVMLICSPAFILFPILDPQGGFRKEILLLALLSTLCCFLASLKASISRQMPIYLGIASAWVVLNHEMLVVYLPYLICAFIIYEKGLGINTKKMIVSTIPAILIAIFLIGFGKGNQEIVNGICSSLKTYAPSDCFSPEIAPGAISFLTQTIPSAHGYVVNSFDASTPAVYVMTALLSFLPLVLMLFSKQMTLIQENREVRFWLAICISATMLGSLPLLWVVADYGRMIYIHAACLSLLSLMLTQDNASPSLRLQLNAKRIALWLFVFLFIVSWRLIHYKASVDNAFLFIQWMFGRFQ